MKLLVYLGFMVLGILSLRGMQQPNYQSTRLWRDVEEVKETADSVDIFTRDGGVIVRNRALRQMPNVKNSLS